MESVVHTIAKESFWPSESDFQDREYIIPWKNLVPGIYKILEIHDFGNGKFGPSVILKLEAKKFGNIFFVWAVDSLVYEMGIRKTTTFIHHIGVKTSENTIFVGVPVEKQKDMVSYEFKLY